jgi:hypothetical protein
MALSKQLAAVLVVAGVACAVAAAAPKAAAAYAGSDIMPPESCQTQINYFANCLARDEIREQCCSVLSDRKCLCQLKREVAVPCHPHRRHGPCPGKNNSAPPVKLSELQHLPCFQGLKCY